MMSCELAASDKGCVAAFDARLDAARPDLVVLEEPWLWPALRRRRAAYAAVGGL